MHVYYSNQRMVGGFSKEQPKMTTSWSNDSSDARSTERAAMRFPGNQRDNCSQPVRAAVVEDDDLVREHLVHPTNQAYGFLGISDYCTAEAPLLEIPRHKPDMVLMDISFPRMSGMECALQLME